MCFRQACVTRGGARLPEAHKALAPVFGIESFAGGVVLDFLAFAVTLLLCFVAGLLARRARATRMWEKLDTTLLNSFPGIRLRQRVY